MGNYKFKLSDMMPNAWFYKLKDMRRAKKQSNSKKKTHLSHPRRSIYRSPETIGAEKFFNSPQNSKFSDTHFPDFPRKSIKIRSKRKTIYKPSPRLSSSPVSDWGKAKKICPRELIFSSSESSDNEFYKSPASNTESDSIDGGALFKEIPSWPGSCKCRVTSSTTDIFIDMNGKSSVSNKKENFNRCDSFSDIGLKPISTKPAKLKNEKTNLGGNLKKEQSTLSLKIVKEGSIKTPKQRKTSTGSRKSVTNSPRVKRKMNSPKIVNKNIRSCDRNSVLSSKQSYQKKIFSKSFAIAKFSIDPFRDFKDSMVEMIVENRISASKDLEELLACFLSLNFDEYHDVIVKAFEQIWFEMASLRS